MIVFGALAASLPAAGVGFVVGAFTPAVGRKIKALFVKETTAAKTAVEAKATTVANDIKAKL